MPGALPESAETQIAVVIPCYRVRDLVLQVIARIPPEVSRVYCVDDACPDGSGALIAEQCSDPRVNVLHNPVNLGVGGAVIAGYRAALADGMHVVVKLDGDGQMAPELISGLVAPLLRGSADYTKGNRFYFPSSLRGMPIARLFGNATLSFLTKLSSGYWTIFDPTNGFTAIHHSVLTLIPLQKLAQRYFFESDMLYQLNLLRAVVLDIPMPAHYGDEHSGLRISRVLLPFALGNLRNLLKRLGYNYFLRDFNIASAELVFGLLLMLLGTGFGATKWIANAQAGVQSSAGTVMLAGLPVLIGFQMLLAFLNFDIQSVPRNPIQGLWRNGVSPAMDGQRAIPRE